MIEVTGKRGRRQFWGVSSPLCFE